MNRQQFLEFVKDPQALDEGTITELENLLKQYPYCQTTQVLLTFNLQKQNHTSYPAQLKRAVAYAGDRRKLKELLEGKDPQAAGHTSFIPIKPVAEPLPPAFITEPIMPAIHDFLRPEPEISAPLMAVAFEPEVLSELEATSHLLSLNREPALVKEVEIGNQVKALPLEPEQENYIEESVISSEELALASPQLPVQQMGATGFISPPHTVNKSSEVHTEKVSQDDLLSIVRKRLAEINEERSGKGRITEPVLPLNDPDKGEPVLRPASEFNKLKNELIEKFIKEEPKISRPKKEFFNPTLISQRSNMDEEDIVSETLALLYAKQGNMQKAIHIYEKLSLRFSEKSRYFAAQIENLNGNTQQAP